MRYQPMADRPAETCQKICAPEALPLQWAYLHFSPVELAVAVPVGGERVDFALRRRDRFSLDLQRLRRPERQRSRRAFVFDKPDFDRTGFRTRPARNDQICVAVHSWGVYSPSIGVILPSSEADVNRHTKATKRRTRRRPQCDALCIRPIRHPSASTKSLYRSLKPLMGEPVGCQAISRHSARTDLPSLNPSVRLISQ